MKRNIAFLVAALAVLITTVLSSLGYDFGAAFAGVSAVLVSSTQAAPNAWRRLAYHTVVFAYSLRAMAGAEMERAMNRAGLLRYAFPGAVRIDQAAGIIGELAFEGPLRAQPGTLALGAGGATAADLVIGRWFTTADGVNFIPGGTGSIGGVLANPKEYASRGTVAGGTLAPTLTMLVNEIGDFVYMGALWIAAPAAVVLGQPAKYNTTTGVIGVGAPGAGEAAIPGSKFIRYPNAAAGLAVLELTN